MQAACNHPLSPIFAPRPALRRSNNIDPRQVGVNPKINNLMTPFAEAKYDLLWVIDSTISVVPGTLARAVDAFMGTSLSSYTSANGDTGTFDAGGELEATPLLADESREPPQRGEVGLVHHVPFAVVHQKTLGSLVEMAFLNTTHAKMYLAIVSWRHLALGVGSLAEQLGEGGGGQSAGLWTVRLGDLEIGLAGRVMDARRE